MFKIRGNISKRSYTTLAVIAFAAVFIIWWLLSYFELVDPVFLPSPVDVWDYFISSVKDGSLWDDTIISVQRICLGVAFCGSAWSAYRPFMRHIQIC